MLAPSRSEDGFGLMEVIVALAIAAAAMTALLRAEGGALNAAGRVQSYDLALRHARAHLDALGSEGGLASGQTRGSYGNGIGWHLSIAALTADVPPAERMYWVVLTALDRSNRTLVKLETAKPGREAQ